MRSSVVSALVTVLVSTTALGGCVSQARFDECVKDAQGARAELTKKAKDDADAAAKLQAQIDDLTNQVQDRDRKLSDMQTDSHNLEQKLGEAQALNQRLADELRKTGKDVDKVLQDKAALAKSLEDMRTQLAELRKAQAVAEARAALFKHFIDKFRALTEAGQLRIVTRRGRLVLQLPNEVLFNPGQSSVKPAGKNALVEIAKVLATMKDRQFQVSGHTDNAPIRTARYPSNWELSQDRALQVTKILIEAGVPAPILSAAGYGEFDPVAGNGSPDGMGKNRRIEITLQPNIEELIGAPELKGGSRGSRMRSRRRSRSRMRG